MVDCRSALLALGLATSAACPQGPPAKVTTTKVIRHTFRPSTTVLGEAEALRKVDVSTEVEGLVEELAVDEGARVEAGDLLLRLRTVTHEIRKRAAKAQLEIAKMWVDQYVRGTRPEEIDASKEAVAETEALLAEAEEDLERQKGLQESDVGSVKELMVARARAHSLRAILRKRKKELELLEQGPRAEVKARAEAQRALRQAELDQIEDEIVRARITAPFRGVLAQKLAEKGAYLRPGEAVFRLVQMDPIRVVVTVPEWLIGRVQQGTSLEIVFDAFPGESFEGKIDAIIPTADRTTRTFPVKLILDNKAYRILPGMVARAKIPTAEGGEALAVPRDAVVRGPMGTVVFKVADGAVQPAPVELGASAGQLVEVAGPLKEGDTVVRRGNEGLRPGQKVIVVGSEGAEPGAGKHE